MYFEIFAPAFGLVLHECIRFNKIFWEGLPLLPLDRPVAYASIVGVLIMLASIVCEALAVQGFVPRAAIGFGITTGIGVLRAASRGPDTEDLGQADEDEAGGSAAYISTSVREELGRFYWY